MTGLRPNTTLSEAILARARSQGRGWAFTPKDLADLADPRVLGVALGRLARAGKIRRVTRGVYEVPHAHPILGEVGAGVDAVVAAIARKKNLRILPSSAVAANQLGLTNQVPAKLVYHTDGAPTSLRLGELTIAFRRNTSRKLALAERASGLVAQALRAFGSDGVSGEHVDRLRNVLGDEQKRELLADIAEVPAWMRPIFRAIAEQEKGS